jgi:putative ABC transport system permease protein
VIPIRYNVRSLMVRRTTSVMTAMGVALVVMILVIMLGFVAGLRRTVTSEAGPNNWIVLSRGITAEPSSFVTREQYQIVRSRPEIAADGSGEALVSPEIVTGFNPDPDGNLSAGLFTFLRGVYPAAFAVHRGIRIASGRWPMRGRAEMVVGRNLAARFPRLVPGLRLRFGRREWTIVGIFADGGSARESEVWTDLDVLEQDIRYNRGFASLHVVLRPGMEDSFERALNRDARLKVDAIAESRFYAQQSGFVDRLRGLGLTIAAILGLGAAFGGMNTMYAAVARRTREVGVLRALGFSRPSILLSFTIESAALGLLGGVMGEMLGLFVAAATGLNSRLMNVGSFIFSFRLSPAAFLAGVIAAVTIGALAGLLPAWRASRIGAIESLRTA